MQDHPIRIGQILIEQGVLSEQQVFEVVQAQKQQRLPFGVLAEQMFDVTLSSIEKAWIEQYHRFTGTVDLDHVAIDEEALKSLNRRQAWQFQILPMHYQDSGELVVAAGRDRLPRAVTFLAGQVEPVVYFRIAEDTQLRRFLQKHYPMPEVSAELIEQGRRLAG